jgi:hypothetical protein
VRNQILKAHFPMAISAPLQILLLHVGEDAVLLFRRGLLGIEPSTEPEKGGGTFGRILMGEFLDCHDDFFCAVNLKFKGLSQIKGKVSRTFFLGDEPMQDELGLEGEIRKLHHGGGDLEVRRLDSLADKVGEIVEDLILIHGFFYGFNFNYTIVYHIHPDCQGLIEKK